MARNEFGLDDYNVGPRIPGEVVAPLLPKAAAPKRPPAAKPVHRQEDEREDPSDPFFFSDQPCETDEDVHSAGALPKVSPKVMKSGSSTAYDKDGLWAGLQASR